MVGKPKKRVPKWMAVLALLGLVSVVTLLHTYTSLGVSSSISALYNDSHAYNKQSNSVETERNSLLQNSLEIFHINTTLKRNVFHYNIRDQNLSTVKLTPSPFKKTLGEKITHIGFLKVHKAGSTTMQNIFFRFGLKYNLTFILPERGHYFLSAKSAMPVKQGNHYDILACHSRYSRKLFGSVLPVDSVNIGIIREPLDRMISAAFYYRDVWKSPLLVKVPKLNFIHNLVKRPDLYEIKPFSKTKNAMGHDFGFSVRTTVNDTQQIERHLDMLKKDFKLVLVMERFEESLILMKRTLNWDLADVIYLKTNSHAHKPVILKHDELNKFKSTCFLDYVVHESFYEIYDKKIAAEGPGFTEEVEHFRSVLHLVKDFCEIGSVNTSQRSLRIAESAWNEHFDITKKDCYYMQMTELNFVNFLKKRHREMNSVHDKMSSYISK